MKEVEKENGQGGLMITFAVIEKPRKEHMVRTPVSKGAKLSYREMMEMKLQKERARQASGRNRISQQEEEEIHIKGSSRQGIITSIVGLEIRSSSSRVFQERQEQRQQKGGQKQLSSS